VILVRIAVLPASKGAVFAPVPGALLEIGRGRARVRVRWELPPGTRLVISLPVDAPILHLEAEVSWVSRAFGRRPEPTEYVVKWKEPLSSGTLQSVLIQHGLTGPMGAAYVRER
jgi:hypothetical protein